MLCCVLCCAQVHDFSEAELQDIISQRTLPPCTASIACSLAGRPAGASADLQAAAAAPLAALAAQLNAAASGASSSGSSSGQVPLQITLREVMKILRRHLHLQLSLADAVVSLLASRVHPGSPAAQQLQSVLQGLGPGFAAVQMPQPCDYKLTSLAAAAGAAPSVRFEASPTCFVDVVGADLSRSSICSDVQAMPAALRAALVHLAFAVAAGEPVMLLGPTCFKSSVVKAWAQIMGQEEGLVKVHLSPGEAGVVLLRREARLTRQLAV